MSLDAEATALKERIATATNAPALDYDEASQLSALPASHTLVAVEIINSGHPRFDGSKAANRRRLTTVVVAKRLSNAYLLMDRLIEEFEFSDVVLDIPGATPRPDDGYFSTSIEWTYQKQA